MLRPGEPGGLAVIFNFVTGSQLAKLLDGIFQLRPGDRLLAQHPPRTVTSPDA